MNTFFKLVNVIRIARICKVAAWLIVAVCALQVSLQIFYIWQTYQRIAQLSQASDSTTSLMEMQQINFYILPALYTLFQSVLSAIFYFALLYVLGTIFSSFTPPKEQDIIYENLDDLQEKREEEGEDKSKISARFPF